MQTCRSILLPSGLAVLLALCAPAQSAGSLDVSLGGTGMVWTSIAPPPAKDRASSIVVQPDDKVIVVGMSYPAGSSIGNWVVVRHAVDGTLDPSFGQGAVVQMLPNMDPLLEHVAIDSAGRILVVGYTNLGWTVVRLLPNGAPDPSFGQNGMLQTNFGNSVTAVPEGVAIQPDGKIVVAGRGDTSTTMKLAMARYTTNGALDNSFGSKGKALLTTGSGGSAAHITMKRGLIALQSDGKIVVGGTLAGATVTSPSWMIYRINSNGTLDTSFGSGGRASLQSTTGSGRYIDGLLVQPDGKIVSSGRVDFGGGMQDFAAARFLSNGAPDPSFGTGGLALAGISALTGWSSLGWKCALQADGSIVVGGTVYYSPVAGCGTGDPRMAAFRFLPDGSADVTFGANGLGELRGVGLPGDQGEIGFGIALDSSGRIVVAGNRRDDVCSGGGEVWRFALQRWLGN